MADQLPLAEITKAVVLQLEFDVIVYVEGRAPGAGGSLVISRSPDRALPPGFFVHAVPGNLGINPGAPFSMAVTAAARVRDVGTFDEYRVIHRDGTEVVRSVAVEEPQGHP